MATMGVDSQPNLLAALGVGSQVYIHQINQVMAAL